MDSRQLQHIFQEHGLRQCSFERCRFIHNGLRNCANAVGGRQVGKLCGLDAVGGDVLVFESELLSQAHGLRAVRSGGRDEDFEDHCE